MKYILGMGNIMRSDDGIGPYLIEYIIDHGLEDGFTGIDIGTNIWNILPLLTEETEQLLIIDCAQMGKQPGTACFFPLTAILQNEVGLSGGHEGDIAQLLHMAKQAKYHIPDIKFMGIEPDCLEYELGLSAILQENIGEYALQAIQKISLIK